MEEEKETLEREKRGEERNIDSEEKHSAWVNVF